MVMQGLGVAQQLSNLNLSQRQLVQGQAQAFMDATKASHPNEPAWKASKRYGEAALRIAKELFPGTSAAPAAAAAPAASTPAQNTAAETIAKLTAQSEAYRKESESLIEAGRLRIAQLEDEELQRQKATELQNRLAIQSAANVARGQAQAGVKLAPGSQTPMTAGTQAFKRRAVMTPIKSTAGINVSASNVLNI